MHRLSCSAWQPALTSFLFWAGWSPALPPSHLPVSVLCGSVVYWFISRVWPVVATDAAISAITTIWWTSPPPPTPTPKPATLSTRRTISVTGNCLLLVLFWRECCCCCQTKLFVQQGVKSVTGAEQVPNGCNWKINHVASADSQRYSKCVRITVS